MTGQVLGVTPVVPAMALFAVLAVLLLSHTAFGRRVYAVGNSVRGAAGGRAGGAHAGLRLCAVGPVRRAGRHPADGFSGQASLGMGDDYLLPSIAAVVVGGGLITGGRGHYLGMLAGVLLLTALQTLLAGSNLPYATRAILYGLVVLGAVIAARAARLDSDRPPARPPSGGEPRRESSMANVAIIGAGLIGRAWALVYARGGHRVRLRDSQPAQVGQALAFAREVAPGLAQAGLLRGRTVDQLLAALEPVGRMEDALRDADYVQESTPERWTASVASMPSWIAWRRLARSWPARPRRCCLRISRPTCLAARVAWWRIRSIHRIWSRPWKSCRRPGPTPPASSERAACWPRPASSPS